MRMPRRIWPPADWSMPARAVVAMLARAASIGDVIDTRYPGTCRDRGLPLSDGVRWRLRLGPGAESFDDLLMGAQSQDPDAQCGDVVIRDHLGQWTYQFVASVDDYRQGIDFVVRGRDLLPSTARQIRIARLIGPCHTRALRASPACDEIPDRETQQGRSRHERARHGCARAARRPASSAKRRFERDCCPPGRYLSADDVPSLFGG